MIPKRFVRTTPFASIVILGLTCLAPYHVRAQSIENVVIASSTQSGSGGQGQSGPGVLSPSGRFLVFASTAENLVSDDSNGFTDIFVKDLSTNKITRVNLPANESDPVDGDSSNPSISMQAPNGFYVVVYESDATNLERLPVPDSNNATDVFFALPGSKITERVSIGIGPRRADGPSGEPSVTIAPEPNRILVAYSSDATNLITNDGNDLRDVFLATITNSEGKFNFSDDLEIIRISVASDGTEANGPSGKPAISGNGKCVVYESSATNLVIGQTPLDKQIYLYNLDKSSTVLLSSDVDGNPGNGASSAPSINYNCTAVVYLTEATDIIADGQTPLGTSLQVVYHDLVTGTRSRVNQTSTGELGDGTTSSDMGAQISFDGRFVIFSDNATNLVSNDGNGVSDIFLNDRLTSSISRLNVALDGSEADDTSNLPSFARKGFTSQAARVGFASTATTLVSSDSEGDRDMFATSFTISKPPLTPATTIEVPPDIVLDDDQAQVNFQEFEGATTSLSRGAVGTKALSVGYVVRARREGETGASRDLRRKVTKRNKVTLKNLKSGTYLVKYRARVQEGKRVISKTPNSPVQRVRRQG